MTCFPMLKYVLELAWARYRDQIPFHHAALALIAADDSVRLHWVRTDGSQTGLQDGAVLPLSVTSLSQVLRGGGPLVRNDLLGWSARHPDAATVRVLTEDGMRSNMVLPLTIQDAAIGALLLSSRCADAFGPEHLELAQEWAASVSGLFARCETCRSLHTAANPTAPACAVSQARRQAVPPDPPGGHDALVDTNRLIHDELRLLAEVTEHINAGVQLHEVLELIYSSFRAILPVDRLTFARIDPGEPVMHIVWTRSESLPIAMDAGQPVNLVAAGLDRVLEAGRIRIIPDLRAFLETHPRSPTTQDLVAAGMNSSMTCPLQVDGEAIGFLFLGSHLPSAYDDDHVRLFSIIARQVAMSLQRSWLYGELLDERERSERLLRNILPADVAEQLKRRPGHLARRYSAVTVLFADLVGFSELATLIRPEELVSQLDMLFSTFDDICEEHGVETIKTLGDGYMAAAGLPAPCADHAERAARAALSIQEATTNIEGPAGQPLQLRIGLHSGPVVAGVIGHRKLHYDLWGDTVNIASRMQSTGLPGMIQCTCSTAELLRERFEVSRRGPVRLKGRGTVDTCFLQGRLARL